MAGPSLSLERQHPLGEESRSFRRGLCSDRQQPKIKRPRRVLVAPAPAFSTEERPFDAAPNRSSYG